jgi:hypothetical protein
MISPRVAMETLVNPRTSDIAIASSFWSEFFINGCRSVNDEVSRVMVERLQRPLQLVRQPDVVLVGKRDQVTVRELRGKEEIW